jgi:two-component system cell cycle response regulator
MTSKKILVVDDSLVILKVLEFKLKSAGYSVLTAPDGAAAIGLARQEKPDLIVLDISFPPDVAHGGGVRWDGFSIMAWMKRSEETARTPVIVITASDPAKVKEKVLAAGAAGFFHKPINHDELLAAIRAALGEPQTAAPPAT